MDTIVSIFGQKQKHNVMQDTWGHLYPIPGNKYSGIMVAAVSEYGHNIIVKSDFDGLESSPVRYELEQTIFNDFNTPVGVYEIKCTLWFFKSCNDMYLGNKIGKIINIKRKKIL